MGPTAEDRQTSGRVEGGAGCFWGSAGAHDSDVAGVLGTGVEPETGCEVHRDLATEKAVSPASDFYRNFLLCRYS